MDEQLPPTQLPSPYDLPYIHNPYENTQPELPALPPVAPKTRGFSKKHVWIGLSTLFMLGFLTLPVLAYNFGYARGQQDESLHTIPVTETLSKATSGVTPQTTRGVSAAEQQANAALTTTAIAVSTFPDALTVVANTTFPQYYTLSSTQSENPLSFPLYGTPNSYATFVVCEGAGGSGCVPVGYGLAIFTQITDAAKALTSPHSYAAGWTYEATLSHCVLLSGDIYHSSFLAMQAAIGQTYPCNQ